MLGDELKDGAYSIRLYFNPLVYLIWVGALVVSVLLLAVVPGFWLSMSDTSVQDIQRALSPPGPTQVS